MNRAVSGKATKANTRPGGRHSQSERNKRPIGTARQQMRNDDSTALAGEETAVLRYPRNTADAKIHPAANGTAVGSE